VTHHEPVRALFLRDGEQGLLVAGTSAKLRAPGDVVEAVGFAEMGTYSAQLRDAVWRVVEHGPEVEAAPIKASQIEQGAHDADLVRIEAGLLDVRRAGVELLLVLRAGENSF